MEVVILVCQECCEEKEITLLLANPVPLHVTTPKTRRTMLGTIMMLRGLNLQEPCFGAGAATTGGEAGLGAVAGAGGAGEAAPAITHQFHLSDINI